MGVEQRGDEDWRGETEELGQKPAAEPFEVSRPALNSGRCEMKLASRHLNYCIRSRLLYTVSVTKSRRIK